MKSRVVGAAMSTALGAGLLAGSVSVPAQAKVIKVCVKKSTGEMRMLTKKKCNKGWKKQTWNAKGKTGPKGDTGAQGPNLLIKDGTGNTVGRYLGTYPGAFGVYTVEINGAAYTYLSNGRLYGYGSPAFKTNTCQGTAYAPADNATEASLYTGMAGSSSRVVHRATNPTFGPARAWSFTTTTEVVNQNIYRLNEFGACVFDEVYSGYLVTLQDVTAPADVPPPLTIQ